MSDATDNRSVYTRISDAVYAAEQGVITWSLLLMTVTYVLQIIQREMSATRNAFDWLILGLMGYEKGQDIPEEVVGAVTSIYTPLFLGVMGLVLMMVAMRTRARVTADAEGARPSGGETPWLGWFLRSIACLAGIYLMLKVVVWIPAVALCSALTAAIGAFSVRVSLRKRSWGGVIGALVGTGIMGAFFVLNVKDDYIWAMEYSSVLLMYVGFFGASMATRDGRHIQVDFIRKNLKSRRFHLYNGLSTMITIAFCLFLFVLALFYYQDELRHGGTLQATRLSESFVSLPIAIAFFFMLIRFSATAIEHFRAYFRGDLPPTQQTEVH